MSVPIFPRTCNFAGAFQHRIAYIQQEGPNYVDCIGYINRKGEFIWPLQA